MASIKNLKKDINYVLGDVIDYALDVSILKNVPEKGERLFEVVESLGYKTVRTFNDWKLIKIRCFTISTNRCICNSRSFSHNLGS